MRFTVAAAILSSALPITSSESSNFEDVLGLPRPSTEGQGKSLVKKFRGYKIEQKVQERQWSSQSEPLVNGQVECNPNIGDSSISDADVGILSCGDGMHCMTNVKSKLGGFCVKDLKDTKQLPPTRSSRRLKEGSGLTAVDLCNTTSINSNYDCDCSDFNVIDGTGTLICVTYQGCLELYGCDDICLTQSFVYSVEADGRYFYESCYDFTSPRNETVCYAYNEMGNCTISFNDEICNSCHYDQTGNNHTEYCTAFDCSNTAAMTTGNTCNDDTVSPAFDTCDFQLNATCFLCGYGTDVLHPELLLEIPSVGNYTCEDIAYYSQFLDKDSCSFIESYAQTSCCDSSMMPTDTVTLAPVASSSTSSPVATPTPAPVAQPTPAPVSSTTTESPVESQTTPEPTDSGSPASTTSIVGAFGGILLTSLSLVTALCFVG